MFSACKLSVARVVVPTLAAAYFVCGQPLIAQQATWNAAAHDMISMLGAEDRGGSAPLHAHSLPGQAMPRGPLARLVENPDRSGGLPPYALADQTGNIQRYVEPVPGIDLASYVDQVVVVRHDSGRTLLASQLELPPQPLYPMVGDGSENESPGMARLSNFDGRKTHSNRLVQQAQYADSDDATVELLEEGEQLPFVNSDPNQYTMPHGTAFSPGGGPVFLDGMPPSMEGPAFGPAYGNSMYYGPPAMQAFPGQYGAPCPQCGGYHQAPGYVSDMGFGSTFGQNERRRTRFYADVEINFMRAHVMEDAIGKLSEKYEFSPRFIVGFEGVGNLDGRVRYWLYRRDTPTLSDDELRLEFDVIDVEATHTFGGRRSEVVLAAGPRFVRFELKDDDAAAGCDLLGITLAADGRTHLFSLEAGRFGWAYGGRLSILAGDWGGEDDNDLVDGRVRDDNVVVHELYAGVDFTCCYRSLDLHARLAFEMQNWHSDVLSESSDASIGIVGPGIQVGAEF